MRRASGASCRVPPTFPTAAPDSDICASMKADSERACRLRLDFPIPTTQPEIDNASRAAAEEPMVWTSPRIAPLMAKKTEAARVTICGLGL